MGARSLSRVVMIVCGVLAALSVAGLITTAVLGATSEKYGLYGEVAIPGSGQMYLPIGEVVITFVAGDDDGRPGLTVPQLNFDITPPPGAPDPTVIEDLGATVAVDGETHRRVWFMRVAAEGGYRVVTGGQVSGFAEPRLAFGQTISVEGPLWIFTAVSIVSVDLAIAAWWFGRRRSTEIAHQAEPG
jgi:hypothetical protein